MMIKMEKCFKSIVWDASSLLDDFRKMTEMANMIFQFQANNSFSERIFEIYHVSFIIFEMPH